MCACVLCSFAVVVPQKRPCLAEVLRSWLKARKYSAAVPLKCGHEAKLPVGNRGVWPILAFSRVMFPWRYFPPQNTDGGRKTWHNSSTETLLDICSCRTLVLTAMKAVRSAALAGPALPVGVIDWPGVASSLWRRHSVAWSPQLCQVR